VKHSKQISKLNQERGDHGSYLVFTVFFVRHSQYIGFSDFLSVVYVCLLYKFRKNHCFLFVDLWDAEWLMWWAYVVSRVVCVHSTSDGMRGLLWQRFMTTDFILHGDQLTDIVSTGLVLYVQYVMVELGEVLVRC
jgi:hypothetical protein